VQPLARPIPSVCDKSENCENSHGYYEEPTGSHQWPIQGTHLQPPSP